MRNFVRPCLGYNADDPDCAAIYAVIGTIAAVIACFTMDKFGRRKLFSK
jgi:hypothetical protein